MDSKLTVGFSQIIEENFDHPTWNRGFGDYGDASLQSPYQLPRRDGDIPGASWRIDAPLKKGGFI
jgi:hypothetical protein